MGWLVVVLIWTVLSQTVAPDLPSPLKTWEESQRLRLEPFFKDGEMNQGDRPVRLYSLVRVAKGFLLALQLGRPGVPARPLGVFYQAFDPIIQVLRPISPLAWLPLGLWSSSRQSEPAALFTIAICAMWPTVINTAGGGAQHHPGLPERRAGAAALAGEDAPQGSSSRHAAVRFHRLPAVAGIAWLVIVAAEMLTGAPGVGGFLWQEYNSLVYSHIILSDHHHRPHRLPPRPADGRGRARSGSSTGGTMAYLEVRGVRKSYETPGARYGC